MQLAHITDLHIGPLPRPTIAQLMTKRILGFISWHKKRKRIHRTDVLEALLQDLHADPPDHVAVTGDLTNLALPQEFPRSAVWLERLGDVRRRSVIPGNHDAYTSGPFRRGWELWSDAVCSDGQRHMAFPYVHRRNGIALIGLSSAVPSPPGCAFGRLGDEQLQRAEALLAELRDERLFRVVLVHHPPLAHIHRRRGLRDAESFRSMIAEVGAELVLSGHEHELAFAAIAGPNGPVPVTVPVVVGPSASTWREGRPGDGGYIRYHINAGSGSILVQLRRFDVGSGCFRAEETGWLRCGDERAFLEPADWFTSGD